MKEEKVEFLEVYRTSSQQEVAFVRSLLDPEGFAYYIENETVNRIAPFGHLGFSEMRVMVEEKRAGEARSLLQECLKY